MRLWHTVVALVLLAGGCGENKEGAGPPLLSPPLAPPTDGGAMVPASSDGGAPVSLVALSPNQPLNFDHRIHAGKFKIPCLTCHVYADHGTLAGIPTMAKCMGCHNYTATDRPAIQALTKAYQDGVQIKWNRVHRVPDHVFFTHERHILAGVACASCHGDVAAMGVVHQVQPFTMGFCVKCHREHGAPVDDCRTCHK